MGNYNHIANHLRCKVFKCVMTLLSQFKLNYHHLHIDSQVKHPNKTLKSLMWGCCCKVNSYIVCLVEQANPYDEGAGGPLVGVPQAFFPSWHFFYFFSCFGHFELSYQIKILKRWIKKVHAFVNSYTDINKRAHFVYLKY